MCQPRPLFHLFLVFSNKHHYNFYNKLMWKNVRPVYSAGIWTHDLQNMSLLVNFWNIFLLRRAVLSTRPGLPPNRVALFQPQQFCQYWWCNYHCTVVIVAMQNVGTYRQLQPNRVIRLPFRVTEARFFSSHSYFRGLCCLADWITRSISYKLWS